MRYTLILILSIVLNRVSAQQTYRANDVQKAIEANDLTKAESVLNTHVNYYFNNKIFDSLPYYILLVGELELRRSGKEKAINSAIKFTEKIKSYPAAALIYSEAYDQLAEFLTSTGNNEMAYHYGKLAYDECLKNASANKERLAVLEGDLGTYSMRMGDVSRSQMHNRNAVKGLLALPNADVERLYITANNMGSSMWMAAKIDSAVYYFDIALNALSKAEKTPHNQYFRPALLNNNMAALFGIQGKTTAAIDAMKSTIDLLSRYLAIKEDLPKRASAIEFQFEATDNLAGIYRELGDLTKALHLLQYSYEQKKKNVKADSSGIYKSEILIGQVYVLMKDFKRGEEMLLQGLKNIGSLQDDFSFWQADAHYSLATMYESQGRNVIAEQNYLRADSLYEASLQGEYDDIYMEFLRNASLFFANHGQLALAKKKANKGFEYVKARQGTNTLLAFYQLLNLGEVSFAAKDYKSSLEYSNQGLATIRRMVQTAEHPLDSIKLELYLPKAILLNVKSKYHLTPQRSLPVLQGYLSELNAAVEMLDKRKSIVSGADDIAILVGEHGDLLEFIKQLNLELFSNTNDIGYIDRLIGLHESGLYMRIRSRLDRSDSIRFAHIPAGIPATEQRIKEQIRNSLTEGGSHHSSMKNYFSALDEWQRFQETVKQKYPSYYEMRYATIFKPMDDVQSRLPESTTLIRYFFIDKDLFAMVIDRNSRNFVSLKPENLGEKIQILSSYANSIDRTAGVLKELYDQLWQPLSSYVKGKKLVIVPDGILYNLSFELLTPTPIREYRDLAKSSLLAKYAISYHYSLFLVGQQGRDKRGLRNFIAFAPGFLDENKNRYVSTISDSLSIDRSYLNLLPQPFSIDFASKAKRLLAGTAFVNEASTAASFRKNAGGNKIIHIGTHAESNNLAPEYSRLIFSKSGGGGEDENSLYLHEIYNTNLTSELAVLTACETGRPGFQDGEGMISLAHAFNYAGSESILTGLWNIDEKSSTILMDFFYANLLEGMDKDEALRQAKMKYLAESDGRMLAPQYWAGLVLMGDTSPVEINNNRGTRAWIFAGLAVCLVGIFIYTGRKGSKRSR